MHIFYKLTIFAIVCCFLFISFSLHNMQKTMDKQVQLEERNNMEYQIMLEDTVMRIWQNERFVADIPYSQIGKLDSVFIKDNE